eukprot:m.205049 g.205049  ORF g.205049 m.205049 type:complete len:102 (-) comp32904_c0_seq2:9-314(-)
MLCTMIFQKHHHAGIMIACNTKDINDQQRPQTASNSLELDSTKLNTDGIKEKKRKHSCTIFSFAGQIRRDIPNMQGLEQRVGAFCGLVFQSRPTTTNTTST